ncbi:MAG TPA: DUF1264 domain-containing protein [Gemmatimonadales bacterium]|nr:DUF1264 domain-containing protein [Gemmatimonadales bacterium]
MIRLPNAVALAALLLAPAGLAAQDTTPTNPLSQFTTHVHAIHWLDGVRYEAHHWFKQLEPGVLQGLVFRTTSEGAPLVEVEWAIDSAHFAALPRDQQRHWHPLLPAVIAGRVTLPDVAEADEAETLKGIQTLYAQTINLAGIEGALPKGLQGVGLATHLAPGETRGH